MILIEIFLFCRAVNRLFKKVMSDRIKFQEKSAINVLTNEKMVLIIDSQDCFSYPLYLEIQFCFQAYHNMYVFINAISYFNLALESMKTLPY